jgi:hypothetical protein
VAVLPDRDPDVVSGFGRTVIWNVVSGVREAITVRLPCPARRLRKADTTCVLTVRLKADTTYVLTVRLKADTTYVH